MNFLSLQRCSGFYLTCLTLILLPTFGCNSEDKGASNGGNPGASGGGGVTSGLTFTDLTEMGVTPLPSPLPAGVTLNHPFDKIDWDVQSGDLTPAKGFFYKILAENQDSDLPARYAGDLNSNSIRKNDPHLHSLQVDLFFNDLSLEEQRIVVLYLNPPPYRALPVTLGVSGVSSLTSAATSSGEVTLRDAPPAQATATSTSNTQAQPNPRPTPTEVPSQDWEYIESISAKLRVWYKKGSARDLEIAQRTRLALGDEIMRKQINLMQREWVPDHPFVSPMRDKSGQPVLIGNGGDAKLDVYIYPGAVTGANAYGAQVTGLAMGVPTCVARPVYMSVNSAVQWENYWDRLKTTLAHEFFHTLQLSISRQKACLAYTNIDEGTATWAKPFTYPQFKHHHDKTDFTLDDELSLRDASYGSWTFYYFMTHVMGSDKMRAAYMAMQNNGPYEAVDSVLDGGFKKQWPDFVEHEWNARPKDTDSFQEWDSYTEIPKRRIKGGGPGQTEDVVAELVEIPGTIGPKQGPGWKRYPMEFDLAPLTRKYYYFDFSTDPNVRSVSLENPVYFQKDRGNLRAFLRNRNDGKWKTVDLMDQYDDKEFCLDTKDESIDEMILMYTNFGHKAGGMPVFGRHDLIVTNLGCDTYKGTYHQTASINSQSATQSLTIDGNITFKQKNRVDGTHSSGNFYTHSSQLTYDYTGTFDGCFGSKSGVVSLQTGQNSNGLGLYAYNAPPAASRGYIFASNPIDPFIVVTHFCAPPKPNIDIPILISVTSLASPTLGMFFAGNDGNLKDQATMGQAGSGNWVFEAKWDLKPVRE